MMKKLNPLIFLSLSLILTFMFLPINVLGIQMASAQTNTIGKTYANYLSTLIKTSSKNAVKMPSSSYNLLIKNSNLFFDTKRKPDSLKKIAKEITSEDISFNISEYYSKIVKLSNVEVDDIETNTLPNKDIATTINCHTEGQVNIITNKYEKPKYFKVYSTGIKLTSDFVRINVYGITVGKTTIKKTNLQEKMETQPLYVMVAGNINEFYTDTTGSSLTDMMLGTNTSSSKGSDPIVKPKTYSEQLSVAIGKNDLNSVKKIIALNKKSKIDSFLLFSAVSVGNNSIISELIKSGANPNVTDFEGVTPLMDAVDKGNIATIKNLAKLGANINILSKNNDSALSNAIKSLSVETVETVLKLGANPNIPMNDGILPIFFAINNRYFDLLNTLIKSNVNVNSKDKDGTTPLTFAVDTNDYELANTLVSAGANVNEEYESSLTLLMYTIRNGNVEISKLLINNKADVNTKTKAGNTALSIATEMNNTELIEILQNAGAKE